MPKIGTLSKLCTRFSIWRRTSMMSPSVLALYGPPASGKSLQATLLANHLGLPVMSASQLLYQEAKTSSAHAAQIKEKISAGELVPDHIILKLVDNWRRQHSSSTYVSDGFPRTLSQAEKLCFPIRCIVLLDLPKEQVFKRLSTRQILLPSGQTAKREDDKESIIEKRLAIYQEATEKVINFYDHFSDVCCIKIDAQLPAQTIHEKIIAAWKNSKFEAPGLIRYNVP